MADSDTANPFGFADKRRTQGGTNINVAAPANYSSVGNMRTRLAAINGAYFTSARLNQMTENDMMMALRLADDLTSI